MAASNADNKPKNIFLSWSGPRSKAAAQAMHRWLPKVIQAASPWMSEHDIGLGKMSLPQIQQALSTTKIGIFFVTADNATNPWLVYEAGAISKTVLNDALVCPYLLDGQKAGSVEPPLGMYQNTPSDKPGTLHLVSTINKAIDGGLTDEDVRETFEMWWSQLDECLKELPPTGEPQPAMSREKMMEAILENTRYIQGQLSSMQSQYSMDRTTDSMNKMMEAEQARLSNMYSSLVGAHSIYNPIVSGLDVYGKPLNMLHLRSSTDEPPAPPRAQSDNKNDRKTVPPTPPSK